MDKIRIKDKTFKPYISSDEIARAVVRVACCIREDVKDERPLFIVMLNGAFVFASICCEKWNSLVKSHLCA